MRDFEAIVAGEWPCNRRGKSLVSKSGTTQLSTTMASQYLQTDDLSILLGLISATLFLLNNLYKPQPLVHPILLGRQSDVGRARNPSESAVYRNYGTGLMGRVCSISSLFSLCSPPPSSSP